MLIGLLNSLSVKAVDTEELLRVWSPEVGKVILMKKWLNISVNNLIKALNMGKFLVITTLESYFDRSFSY